MKQRISLNSILFTILIIVFFSIIIGTVFVFAGKKAEPGNNLRKTDPSPESIQNDFSVFNNLGQIRASTLSTESEKPVTIIIEPWFSYENNDSAFEEELLGKRRKIKGLITSFFSQNTFSQLKSMGEGSIKTQLINLINNELVLGKMSMLYFEKYLFLE